eukprot:7175536-Prymnesium_polylepis.1
MTLVHEAARKHKGACSIDLLAILCRRDRVAEPLRPFGMMFWWTLHRCWYAAMQGFTHEGTLAGVLFGRLVLRPG